MPLFSFFLLGFLGLRVVDVVDGGVDSWDDVGAADFFAGGAGVLENHGEAFHLAADVVDLHEGFHAVIEGDDDFPLFGAEDFFDGWDFREVVAVGGGDELDDGAAVFFLHDGAGFEFRDDAGLEIPGGDAQEVAVELLVDGEEDAVGVHEELGAGAGVGGVFHFDVDDGDTLIDFDAEGIGEFCADVSGLDAGVVGEGFLHADGVELGHVDGALDAEDLEGLLLADEVLAGGVGDFVDAEAVCLIDGVLDAPDDAGDDGCGDEEPEGPAAEALPAAQEGKDAEDAGFEGEGMLQIRNSRAVAVFFLHGGASGG